MPDGGSSAPLDVDAIRERVEWRRTMGGRSPGVHPTLLVMEQDIDALLAERDRLDLEAQECLDCRERARLREQVKGLTRHRDGCVAKLEAIRAEVEVEQRVGTGASLAGNVLAILNREPTP